MGGRLDATNVVEPLLTVITTIGLDHEDRLGSTLEEIAAEKGGIIKAGVPVVSGVQSPDAEKVLKRIALEKQADWRSTKEVPWVGHGWSLAGGSLTFPGLGLVNIGLLGGHQLQNAATALVAIMELRKLGLNPAGSDSRLSGSQLARPHGGGFTNPFILFDGAQGGH